MRTGDVDSWTVDRDGITYRIDLTGDEERDGWDPRGNDDGMREETAEAHARGDWRYVIVTVTAMVPGIGYPASSASLHGVEYGTLPPTSAAGIPHDDPRFGPDGPGVEIGREYLTSDPVPELIDQVRENLAKLRGNLDGLDLS